MQEFTLHEVDIFARTIYGEARGESYFGMYAVACVVMNRLKDRRWPKDVDGVCRQPWQFSCWNPVTVPDKVEPNPNTMAMLNAGFDWVSDFPEAIDRLNEWRDPTDFLFRDEVFASAYAIAIQALIKIDSDPTGGATHYYAKGTPMPKWAKDRKPCAEIGRHLFFNDVP